MSEIKMKVDDIQAGEEMLENIASIEFIDNDARHSDDLQMIVYEPNDFAGKKSISLSIVEENFRGTNKSAALDCGTFQIDFMKADDISDRYIIKAAAVPCRSQVRQSKKSKAWERINLKELAGQLAQENGLQLVYASQLNPVFVRKEQLRESDISFLYQVCEEVGLSLKFTTNSFVIFNPYEYGNKEPVRTFEKGDSEIKDIRLLHRKNDADYAKCRLSYINPVTNELIDYTYVLKDQGKVLDVTRKVSSTEEARLAAIYAIKEKNSKAYTGRVVCEGDISLATGAVIKLSGYEGYDRNYIITKASHCINNGIYLTRIDFEMVLEGY